MSTDNQRDWDVRFLDLARSVATWSKDPSTQCGAVIVNRRKRLVSVGFNGFAAGVNDDPARLQDRDVKYDLTIHAEDNAVLFAERDLWGCTLYTWPMAPCSRCAAKAVQAGIFRVVAPFSDNARWVESIKLAAMQYAEANVRFDVYFINGVDVGGVADGCFLYR